MLDTLEIEMDCLVLTKTWTITDKELFDLSVYNNVYNENNYNQNYWVREDLFRSSNVIDKVLNNIGAIMKLSLMQK